MSSFRRFPLSLVTKPAMVSIVGVKNKLQEFGTRQSGGTPVSENEEVKPRTEVNKRLGNNICKKKATQMVETYMETSQVPGMSIGVSVNGKTVYKKGFGYQDVGNKVKCTGDMMGNIASITKLYLAYFTLRTIQTCPDFDITSSVSKYLPEVGGQEKQNNNQITTYGCTDEHAIQPLDEKINIKIMHLLSHTSGVRHHVKGLNFKVKCPDIFSSYRYVLNDDLKVKPGEGFCYTSIGCQMLAAVLQVVLDRDFDDFATDELLLLNLQNTHFVKPKDLYLNKYRGYKVNRGILQHGEYCDYSWFNASEGIITNVEDMVKFGNIMFTFALSDDCSQLLEKYWAQKLFKIYARNTNLASLKQYNDSGVGLLWHIGVQAKKSNCEKDDTVRRYFHNGSSRTGTSTLMLRWENKLDDEVEEEDDELAVCDNYQRAEIDMIYQNNAPATRETYKKFGQLVTVAVISNGQMCNVEEIAKSLGELFAKEYTELAP